MKNRKPTLEKISPNFGSSVFVKKSTSNVNDYKPYWHFHPEIELIYVNKGQGKRHIGSHLSYFNNSQLILIGSNLPHNGFTDRLTQHGSEVLVQFKPEFLGAYFFDIPEMANINALFERSKNGILFKPETKRRLGKKIQKLDEVEGFERILLLLKILKKLAEVKDYEILNANGFVFETELQDSGKIDIIYKHINNNFQKHISLDEISDKVSMTVPAFCRYFKKSTGKTFTKLVNEYRIVHATKLLSESQMSIADVAFECGFNNFSHFNKLFKEFTGKSALKYRKELTQIMH
ncbi:AraC family transcriptional regulator [Psychroserpens luteus]|uniref:AraC family transcriptional regulator n=1 Tax=Psychroserpens luteus TaxID=1434066 RepID=A0ABW5ZV14_9FLAO|nr:AraC family transcriptional regulator [Psychroserpens luteus]